MASGLGDSSHPPHKQTTPKGVLQPAPQTSVAPPSASQPSSSSSAKKPTPTKGSPSAGPTPNSLPAPLLFAFNGPDRLDTNAYAYWNHNNCAPSDPDWQVTSGSWFIHNGAGYSGKPSVSPSDSPCSVTYETAGAYQLRMNTVRSDFVNTDVQLDYDLVSHGGYGGKSNSYDGLHIWSRHVSQYELYAVSIGRWDGTFVVKKKVPTQQASCPDPANDGCYVDISSTVTRTDLVTANVWRHADITTKTLASGNTEIDVSINGVRILTATDSGALTGKTLGAGAVGIRGDNTEFYVKNFQITTL